MPRPDRSGVESAAEARRRLEEAGGAEPEPVFNDELLTRSLTREQALRLHGRITNWLIELPPLYERMDEKIQGSGPSPGGDPSRDKVARRARVPRQRRERP